MAMGGFERACEAVATGAGEVITGADWAITGADWAITGADAGAGVATGGTTTWFADGISLRAATGIIMFRRANCSPGAMVGANASDCASLPEFITTVFDDIGAEFVGKVGAGASPFMARRASVIVANRSSGSLDIMRETAASSAWGTWGALSTTRGAGAPTCFMTSSP